MDKCLVNQRLWVSNYHNHYDCIITFNGQTLVRSMRHNREQDNITGNAGHHLLPTFLSGNIETTVKVTIRWPCNHKGNVIFPCIIRTCLSHKTTSR